MSLNEKPERNFASKVCIKVFMDMFCSMPQEQAKQKINVFFVDTAKNDNDPVHILKLFSLLFNMTIHANVFDEVYFLEEGFFLNIFFYYLF